MSTASRDGVVRVKHLIVERTVMSVTVFPSQRRSDGGAMPTHKFKIGQTVFLSPSPSLNIPGGAYIVTRKLPERDGEYVYQVKSANEPHQRIVRESEISDVP
jgi:hypothetical protein